MAKSEMARSATSKIPTRTKLVPGSLGGRVYEALKRDIVLGVFPAGEPLSEKLLASRYSGSRTPLREAAVRLQQENLLRIIPNKGYFIVNLSVQQVNELYEYRAAMEGLCAEIAAKRIADPVQLDELERLASVQFEDRPGYFKFIESDTAFHVGIAKLTGNKLFIRAVAEVRVQTERLMYAASSVVPYGGVVSREHRAIVKALRERNGKLASQLLQRHILGAKESILELAGGGSYLL